jgi:hypothetical protein
MVDLSRWLCEADRCLDEGEGLFENAPRETFVKNFPPKHSVTGGRRLERSRLHAVLIQNTARKEIRQR